ncbi:MAG: hypothetical protein M3R63_09875 [Actinomycetota bacterium]|nr:hypothetical protein [Actinomycetota bacterium]
MSSPPPPGTGTAAAETVRKIDINATQVSASALAAITAAVLGSFVGVAGTVIGAALASIITTVSSTVYQQTLERSRQRMSVLTAARTRPLRRQEAAPTAPSDPLEESPTPGPASGGPRRPLRWTAVVAGSVAAFAIAMTMITGFESAIGQSLSGGDEPTLARIATGSPAQPEPSPEPAAPTESAVPSEAPSSPSSEPETGTSGTAEPEPSSTPEPSDAPETTENSTEPLVPLLPG